MQGQHAQHNGGPPAQSKHTGGDAQKRPKDSRHWRYVDVFQRCWGAGEYHVRVKGDRVEWPSWQPAETTWNAFFAQTDPRRQKVHHRFFFFFFALWWRADFHHLSVSL
jgi:hypothetical protein